MTLTQEELAAYADGELEGAEAARVLLAVVASPELMGMVQRHRALRERIGAEFAPILDQEVPERLTALLRPPCEEAERGTRRQPQEAARASQDNALPPRSAAMRSVSTANAAGELEESGEDRRHLRLRRWLLLPVLAAALAAAATLPREGVRGPAQPTEQPAATVAGL